MNWRHRSPKAGADVGPLQARRSRRARGLLLCAFLFSAGARLAAAPEGQAATEQPYAYYLYKGGVLRGIGGSVTAGRFTEWQVWLYPERARTSAYGSALTHTRWGVIRGPSGQAVMEQLAALQRFERAYVNFFGASAWGPFTFSHPIGPIAIMQDTPASGPGDLLARANLVNSRLYSATAELRASLENAGNGSPVSPLKSYFEQARDCLTSAARLSDEMSRVPGQRSYLALKLAQLNASVSQAESGVAKVTAILPNVKLPANQNWMTHEEPQGSDGTLEVRIAEIGAAAWVRQRWTGGDGGMAGTVVVTIVPYQQIGNLTISTPLLRNGREWALRVESNSQSGFPQSVSSPARTTAVRTYAPVDLNTSEHFVYFVFANLAQAQDAYDFFLYHKQRGG